MNHIADDLSDKLRDDIESLVEKYFYLCKDAGAPMEDVAHGGIWALTHVLTSCIAQWSAESAESAIETVAQRMKERAPYVKAGIKAYEENAND